MRLLVLGGTVFLGRHVTAEALRRGHEVTVFHRGRHGADLFAEAEHVLGDRGGDLAPLRGRAWDAAIDTSGYEPADVGRSSALDLGHLVFVSSCNVYPAWPAEPVDEDSPVWTEGDDYGPLKAECERVAEAAMPGRVASVRAGLICGPHDNIFRLPWWVQRIAAGGDVVAPGNPDRTVQLVDARDLAAWMLDLAEQRIPGAFNGTAPPGRTTMREALEAAVQATGGRARLQLGARRRPRRPRRRALGRAAAVDPARDRRGNVGGGHRARAGGRPALPPGGRDRGRHVGLAARRRRRGDGRLARGEPPARAHRPARAGAARSVTPRRRRERELLAA